MTDTHTHLYLNQFDGDRKEVIQRAKDEGVQQFYLPNIDSTTIEGMLQMEKDFPSECHAMMGLHPCSVKEDYQKELATVKEWLGKRPFCAIGEIGIDLYWDKTFFEEQKKALVTQIGWAKELGIPIIIHSRDSTDIIIEIIKKEKDSRLMGIFHCFTGTPEQAQKIIDLDFFMGIGGVVTFKNAGLDKTVADIPLERLVLETDSPYLAPVPKRGKRNESAYIKQIATKLSEAKQVSFEQIAVATTANAKKIFAKNSLPYTTVY
ncbi:MAG TPA: TatD family deoxyribonuclease [Bacteroidetes bacterium]|nr:TatD family deoxyribonuclease [Bacteroidota bacterium]